MSIADASASAMHDPCPAAPAAAGPDGDDETLTTEDFEAVLDVTRALATPFDLDTLLGTVTDAACRVLHAERSSVWLLDDAHQHLVLEVAHDLPALRLPVGRGLVGHCAAGGMPLNVPDCYADPRFEATVDRATGFRTRNSLSLPLVDHRGRLIGVMQVINHHRGPFGPRDVSRGEALAAQCAVALSRVRLAEAQREAERLHRELELARQVQMATLPHSLPPVDGYELQAVFQPAEQTGGDAYDLAPLPQGLLLVLADAAGHGIAPALAVTQMHAMLRMALRLGADLETAFTQVNDQLAETLHDSRFVCAFVGLLDAARHELRFLSGGQGPILHLRACTGTWQRHSAGSPPLGAMPLRRRPHPRHLLLEPGDVLALITDGVFEQPDRQGRLFGVEAAEAVLQAQAAHGADAMAHALLAALAAHADGQAAADDVTFVLVRRTAP